MEIEGSVDAWSKEEMESFINEHDVVCPTCGKKNFTEIRQFNLMFKTFQGVTEDAKNTVYLRPETAQGIFVNFKNVQRTSRKKIPFGIGQIGKSFRNEITPGNFTFRTREFEQMELEFFCEPDKDLEWFEYWKNYCINWLQTLGIKEDEIDVYKRQDWDGNELLLSDILGTDEDIIYKDLEHEVDKKLLTRAMTILTDREKMIIELRFGINQKEGKEKTQKEVADMLGISQSYISRLEKKIIKRLKREMIKMGCV